MQTKTVTVGKRRVVVTTPEGTFPLDMEGQSITFEAEKAADIKVKVTDLPAIQGRKPMLSQEMAEQVDAEIAARDDNHLIDQQPES